MKRCGSGLPGNSPAAAPPGPPSAAPPVLYHRLNVGKLVERHGADAKLPDLREVLASDCPRVGAASVYERCGVHYPQLLVAVRSLLATTA
jgi:hypothetical protein